MHEYHSVEALIDRLSGQPEPELIGRVRVRVGAALSAEALGQAYEMLTQDTPLEGSLLVVESRTAERACPACGTRWVATFDDLAGHLLFCPSCGAPVALDGSATIEVVEISRDRRAKPE
jgi:Zn finger protein HypA/HybF involved in hydrogenase expression